MTTTVAIYAQIPPEADDSRERLERLKQHAQNRYDEPIELAEYLDLADDSGCCPQYRALNEAIEDEQFDLIVVERLGAIARLGAGELESFIQHCLLYGAGIEGLDVGLEIYVRNGRFKRRLYSMVAEVMGRLAAMQREQTFEQLSSGVRAAQEAGKWTGRPPRGFTVDDDGYLRLDVTEYLETRHALARIERGDSKRAVAQDTGIARSTLRRLYDQRRELYLGATSSDDRIDEALEEFPDIDDISRDTGGLDARIRHIIQDELG